MNEESEGIIRGGERVGGVGEGGNGGYQTWGES